MFLLRHDTLVVWPIYCWCPAHRLQRDMIQTERMRWLSLEMNYGVVWSPAHSSLPCCIGSGFSKSSSKQGRWVWWQRQEQALECSSMYRQLGRMGALSLMGPCVSASEQLVGEGAAWSWEERNWVGREVLGRKRVRPDQDWKKRGWGRKQGPWGTDTVLLPQSIHCQVSQLF